MKTRQAKSSGAAARERLLAGIPVAERRVRCAGIATSVLEGGQGEGPPVLLLHGPAGSALHWMRVLPALARAHRVVAPDLPGHGASEVPEGPLDGDRMVAWLGELIERTSPSPVLVGYALGGAIAARFAIEHGDRISGLVLVDAFGLAALEPTPEFGAALQLFLVGPSERTHDDLWRYCARDLDTLRARIGDDWDAFRAYNVDRARVPGAMGALGDLIGHCGAPAIPPGDLARIAVPTRLIWGRDDLATPLAIAAAASARYGWPLQVIEDCADDPPIEQPEAFVRALRSASDALTDAAFAGEIIGRDHPRYDELRSVFNGMIDRRPALIARCTSAHDVCVAVNFARERGLPLSVYGGGHNVTGNAVCDDGVTIDLRPMRGIEVDPETRTCRVEGGVTWGELDAATQEHGLAVTGGRMSTTGIGGLVLGGGSGWIERTCGFSVDNLRSIETVTADGRVLVASETEHPDLFWGTRGGGGNFGVVTRFEFGLHPIGPTVLGGMLLHPASMAPAVLRGFRDVMADAPDEVGAGVALLTAPPEAFVPESMRGRPACGVIVCHTGPVAEGKEALRALRELGPPAIDTVQPMPYVAFQQLIDAAYPSGMRNHWTGDFLSRLPDEAIDVLCRYHRCKPSPWTQILVLPGGGALARVPDGAMAIGQRQAPFNVHITSLWPEAAGDDANIAWTRELGAAIKPFTTGRVYVNFIGDEGRERVVAAFGDAYPRLQALKERYDPENLFRSNQNIEPGAVAPTTGAQSTI